MSQYIPIHTFDTPQIADVTANSPYEAAKLCAQRIAKYLGSGYTAMIDYTDICDIHRGYVYEVVIWYTFRRIADGYIGVKQKNT